jgi:hypothetical protein
VHLSEQLLKLHQMIDLKLDKATDTTNGRIKQKGSCQSKRLKCFSGSPEALTQACLWN